MVITIAEGSDPVRCCVGGLNCSLLPTLLPPIGFLHAIQVRCFSVGGVFGVVIPAQVSAPDCGHSFSAIQHF